MKWEQLTLLRPNYVLVPCKYFSSHLILVTTLKDHYLTDKETEAQQSKVT